jgi:glycosyltransferase involved in cell wall biosynthesis
MPSIIKSVTEVVEGIQIKWFVMFDTSKLKDIDADLLSSLRSAGATLEFSTGQEGDFGHGLINSALDRITEGWVYILDDDNIIHPGFFSRVSDLVMGAGFSFRGIVYNQRIDGKDFTGQEIRYAAPENMRVGGVDSAQLLLRRDLIADRRLRSMTYVADSVLAEELHRDHPSEFMFLDEELCYYNYFHAPSKARLPKIMLRSDEPIQLRSEKRQWFESDELDVSHVTEFSDSRVVVVNPDLILDVGGGMSTPGHLASKSVSVGRSFERIGDMAYNASMISILDGDHRGKVSFFTPIYNTGDRLYRLYDSFKAQTHTNWEWVIVNDSTDGGKTLKMAEAIAAEDSRISLYDFRQKSRGVIGESKYRAATLAKGEVLAEIDHDDFILPESAELLVRAFNKHPDAGFAYTDCVEILEDWRTTLMYPEGFCFGYGKYRTESCMGIEMNVNESPNINPKTIRHIVGIPNHIRAWRRDTYLELGGHNRRLSIADDYELVVRTFLKTRFVRIKKNCYLQFIYNTPGSTNTHEIARADIQRRVRTIGDYYNVAISKRFEELGIEDWASMHNQSNPLSAPSRFGAEEGAVKYDMEKTVILLCTYQ